MRVIAGKFRSRRLKTVPGQLVRPTPDRLKEALFNVLAPRMEGAVFLDAYAGSGAVAIEALSRGAAKVILFERNPEALAVIRENLTTLEIRTEAVVIRGKALSLYAKYPADIVFVDPPYEQVSEYAESLQRLAEMACPLVIAQHESRLTLDDAYGALEKKRILRQGDNTLSFFSPAD